ncbi:MAG: DNA primase [Candidatus Pacebacteria bacterium]|nr:DNA primase [Candidatus Paceibacterota bacterium]
MNSPVQQIKERLSIEEVVSSYIKLEKAGANLKAKCPFHNEKTPSFFISPDRGTYYCFGCGVKGDIFTFVEEFEGLDFRGALKLLASRAGIVLESYNPKDQRNQSEKERLYEVMEEATVFFEKNLKENPEVSSYLKNRGLNDESIKNFRIGFALLEWRKLYDYLKSKNFSDSEIEKAGLAKTPSAVGTSPLIRGRLGGGLYDRFRGRIMFPISDSSGRVIAFSGRIFVDDGKSAKYLNSPETSIFNKSAVLFGIDKAKDPIRKNDFSILVEGQMDLILSHQAGFKNTVASSGTAMTDSVLSKENIINNLGLITRLSKNMVLAYDADRAGVSATNRFAKIALSLGMDVKVADIPEGMDPADLISRGYSQMGEAKVGVDAWREAIRNSKHFIEFMLLRILKDTNSDNRKAGREIKERLLPFVNEIESSIEKSHFITLISNKSGIPENALMEDLKKVETEFKNEKEDIKIAKENIEKKLRKDPIERRLLGIAFWQESLSDVGRPKFGRPTSDKTSDKPRIDPELIFKKLEKAKENVKEKYKDRREDLIYEVEEFYSNNENLEKDVEEMLLNIEEEYLNEEFSIKMIEYQNCKDKIEKEEIFKKISEITKRKEDIKNSRIRK